MPKLLITGATGYIGSMLIKHLQQKDKEIGIVALVRNMRKAVGMLPGNVQLFQADLADRMAMAGIRLECDAIIHCASVTKSAEMISRPVETIESIVNATQNVLELARRCRIKSMVYLSSMEIYGNVDCSDGHRVSEEELGDIDIFQTRSCYPLGKRMAENICYSYFKEYGVPVKIVRLAQTFGQGILPTETKVFAQFTQAAKKGADIVLHTSGNSMGNYCSIHDTISGILTVLEHGTDGEAYNVVNEKNTMTIRQMAELVADKIADKKIKVVYDIPQDNQYGYAAETGLRLSGKKLEKLGWAAKDDMVKMYQEAYGEAVRVQDKPHI